MKRVYWVVADKRDGVPKDVWKNKKDVDNYIQASGYGQGQEFFTPRKIVLDVGKDWRDRV